MNSYIHSQPSLLLRLGKRARWVQSRWVKRISLGATIVRLFTFLIPCPRLEWAHVPKCMYLVRTANEHQFENLSLSER